MNGVAACCGATISMAAKHPKVRNLSAVARLVAVARKRGKTIVTTNGCFDILHIGHVNYLQEAKKHGDLLIVGVNSDASVRAIKGAARPIVPARERAAIVASLECVDAVLIFSETEPDQWLLRLRPDIHVKGGDKTMADVRERGAVERGGGVVALMPVERGRSTTNIIQTVVRRYARSGGTRRR